MASRYFHIPILRAAFYEGDNALGIAPGSYRQGDGFWDIRDMYENLHGPVQLQRMKIPIEDPDVMERIEMREQLNKFLKEERERRFLLSKKAPLHRPYAENVRISQRGLEHLELSPYHEFFGASEVDPRYTVAQEAAASRIGQNLSSMMYNVERDKIINYRDKMHFANQRSMRNKRAYRVATNRIKPFIKPIDIAIKKFL